MFRYHIQHILRSPISLLGGIVASGLLSRLVWSFTDLSLIQGNQGTIWMYNEITFNMLFALLFGLLVAATIYKRRYMNNINTGGSAAAGGLVGSFLGTLVAGCPACTITLASYIGIASVISVLPRGGIELKIIGLGLMIRSVYKTIHTLHQCKLQPTKKGT